MPSGVRGYLGIDLILNLVEERALAIRHIEITPCHSLADTGNQAEVQWLLSIKDTSFAKEFYSY